MKKMVHQASIPLTLLSLFLIIQLTPTPVRAWVLVSGEISPPEALPVGFQPVTLPAWADLNGDATLETLQLSAGRLSIQTDGRTTWLSPADWQVSQAAITDLDRNGMPEAALLLWRSFQPWPVDVFLPHGGRIAAFHDGAGFSCHFILVGWQGSGYAELWAGSALADPITTFTAADLDGDSAQELITLEGHYAARGSSAAHALKVWEWNGFGFSIVSIVTGRFSTLTPVRAGDGSLLILTP